MVLSLPLVLALVGSATGLIIGMLIFGEVSEAITCPTSGGGGSSQVHPFGGLPVTLQTTSVTNNIDIIRSSTLIDTNNDFEIIYKVKTLDIPPDFNMAVRVGLILSSEPSPVGSFDFSDGMVIQHMWSEAIGSVWNPNLFNGGSNQAGSTFPVSNTDFTFIKIKYTSGVKVEFFFTNDGDVPIDSVTFPAPNSDFFNYLPVGLFEPIIAIQTGENAVKSIIVSDVVSQSGSGGGSEGETGSEQCNQAKDTAWTVIAILPVALFFGLFAIFSSLGVTRPT